MLNTAGEADPELEAALTHMAGCPACTARLRHLPAAAATDDQLDCAACEPQLPEFLAARAAGEADQPAWDSVRQHLAGCAHCAAVLRDLEALYELAEAPALTPVPAPRLDFLRPAPAPPWRLDNLGTLLVDLARALRPALESPAGLKRGGGTTLEEGELRDALPDLELRLALEEQGGEARRRLRVTVHIPSRGGWPNLAGSEVVLRRGEEELDSQLTDSFGTVVFADLEAATLGDYSLAVRPATSTKGAQ